MKKIISLILSAVMLLSITAGMSTTAFALNTYTVNGTGKKTVTIDSEGYADVEIIPTETAVYYVHSKKTGETDPYAELYWNNGGELEIIDYCDDFDGYDFGFLVTLEKNKVYYLKCRTYGEATGVSYDVIVEKNPFKSISLNKKTIGSYKELDENWGYTEIDSDDNEFFYYGIYDNLFAVGDTVTVTYNNGTNKVYTGKTEYWTDEDGTKYPYVILEASDGSWLSYNIQDGQYEKHWGVGRHTVKVTAFGMSFSTYFDINKANGWYKKANKWFYSKNGVDQKGWQKISGKWYYFTASGINAGVMATGWQKISGKWYYFNSSGAMVTGWQKISGKWYLFNSSGAMLTGWQKSGGKWYYFNSSGAMVTGWQKIGGKWYYFNSAGDMRTANLKQGKKTYRFNSSGVCLNP